MKKFFLFLMCFSATYFIYATEFKNIPKASAIIKNFHKKIFIATNDPLINNIKIWQTNKNIRVYFLQTKNLPMLDVRVIFNIGSGYDKEKFGLSYLTNLMLKEGTNKFSSNEIALKFDNLGVNFYVDTKRDFSYVAIRTLIDENITNTAINLFTNILNSPSFIQKEFVRVQNQTLTEIQMENQQPAIIANNNFYNLLYKNHPYAHNIIGTEKTIKEITTSDIKDFYSQYYVAQNANIVLVGDIDLARAKKYAEKISNNLKSGIKAKPLTYANTKPKIFNKTVKYDSNQSYIRIGFIGINYQDKNLFPCMVGNYILGGGMSSRLFTQVRDKNGFSYNVDSYMIPLKYNGVFLISLQTKSKTKNAAAKLSKTILKNFINFGVSDVEIDKAKKYLSGSFALDTDNNSNITDLLTLIAAYNLPNNYLINYISNVNTVNRDNINETFKKLFKNKNFFQVIVG